MNALMQASTDGDVRADPGHGQGQKNSVPKNTGMGMRLMAVGMVTKARPTHAARDLGQGHDLAGGHVAQHREDHHAREHGKAAVDEHGHEGVVVDVRAGGQVAGIGDHDGEAHREGEEYLP
jgi:hypothetical protein